MTNLRSAQNRRARLLGAIAVLGLLPLTTVHAGPRLGPGAPPSARNTAGPLDPDQTGSIPPTTSPSFRSSVLGNAEAPEREPAAQRLGNTSGGGLR